MGKILVWAITLMGLVPAVWLVIVTAYVFSILRSLQSHARYGGSFIHDTYVSLNLGSLNVTVYPRVWVLVLIAFGIACVVGGLVFLLHIPES
jgi:hypothetical protein